MSCGVEISGDSLRVSGNMTLGAAADLLERGLVLAGNKSAVFDLADVREVDSSGLAVLFGWLRAAQAQGNELRIVNPPQNLISLAQVYGVGELLSLS